MLKRFSLHILLVTVLTGNIAGADWVWQNPYPYGNGLGNVFAFDSNNVLALGDFADLLSTKDGGITWECNSIHCPDTSLNSFSFADSLYGWAVGYYGTVLKTTDGGKNWTSMKNGPAYNLLKVFFVNRTTGWACGTSGNGGVILKTIDGGINWDERPESTILSSCFFISENVGWVAGYNGKILKTTNGGATWISQNSPSSSDLHSICFVNDSTGWAVGSRGIVMKTSNGGLSWTFKQVAGANVLTDVFFVNSDTGFVVGNGGSILITIDGGSNWTPQNSGTTESLASVRFLNSQAGWVAGNGFISKTINAGKTWLPITRKITSNNLNSVCFSDSNNGWAVGNNGTILSTENGGTTWTIQTSGSNNLNCLFFPDSSNGLIVGDGGTILRTTNSGLQWLPASSPVSNNLTSIHFPSPNAGWICGAGGTVLRTSNGGANWVAQNSYTMSTLYSIFFINELSGWAAGNNGALIRTSDGGNDWSSSTTLDLVSALFIYFSNIDTGWTGGNPRYSHPRTGSPAPCLLSTINGGSSWSQVFGGYSLSPSQDAFLCMRFFDKDTGWALQTKNRVFSTLDAGRSWKGNQSIPVNRNLFSFYFVNGNTGWFVGEQGTILKIKTGARSITDIYQSKPQPLNNHHALDMQIMGNGSPLHVFLVLNLARPSFVTIDIYDILGRRIFKSSKKWFQDGRNKIPIDDFRLRPSVYFFMVRVEDKTIVKQVTLL